MFDKLNEMKAREWLMIIISTLILTDLLILLNVPFLREIASFLFFTFVPGLLILQILRLNKVGTLKKLVLSVGLSVSFIIFAGLVVNSIYPLVGKPLSLIPLLTSFNLIVIVLALAAYWRNRNDFNAGDIFNLNLDMGDKLKSPMIFPVLFPLLAVLGTYLMNTAQNNIILMAMLFLIPAYLVAVVYLKDRIHPATYPIALSMIGMGLLLMNGLTSSYIMGRDVHYEYYCFQMTLSNFHWNIYDYYNPYNACLSLTILPAVYKVLTGLSGQYVFKLLFGIIGSVLPLIVYMVCGRYLDKRYAFLASLLLVFQIFFVYLMGCIRQEIAILFFFLAVMMIFDRELNRPSRKVLFLIFMFSIVVSHYTTSYVSFILLLPLLAFPFLKSLLKDRKLVFTNFDVMIISGVFILIWYLLFAKVQFSSGAQVVATTVASTAAAAGGSGGAIVTNRGAMVLSILGIKFSSVPNAISVFVHDFIFAVILVGLATILLKFKSFKNRFEDEYILGMIISIFLLALFVALPYISIAYDPARLFFQLLIFLAPVFIVGAVTISKVIKRPNWNVAIIVILLIAMFSCATYLQYHFYGLQYSPNYDENGIVRGESYIYPSEIVSADWLHSNGMPNSTIYSDGRELTRFTLAYGTNVAGLDLNYSFFAWNRTVSGGYIYLGDTNVKKHEVIEIYDDIWIGDMNDYSELFKGRYKIYDNGGSQIWA